MISKKRWEEEEIITLLHNVKENPHNLSEVFRKHAAEYNRTYGAVAQFYYWSLKHGKFNTNFMLVSSNTTIPNYKIVRNSNPTLTLNNSWLSRIKDFIHKLLMK